MKTGKTITFEEAEENFEAVCGYVEYGHPIYITKENSLYLVILDFDEYLDIFGSVLSKDVYSELKELKSGGKHNEKLSDSKKP